jgi:hypothetical protein
MTSTNHVKPSAVPVHSPSPVAVAAASLTIRAISGSGTVA